MHIWLNSRKDFESRFQALDEALNASHSSFIITKDLEIVDKGSVSWKILCLFQPFYRLFCQDVYSHVRANRVAQGILQTCQDHQSFLRKRPILVEKIEKQILQRLKSKTHGKYDADIDKAITELNSIIQGSPRETEKDVIDESFVNPLSLDEDLTLKPGSQIHWPIGVCLKSLEISEISLNIVRGQLKNGFRDLVRNPTHDLRFIKESGRRKLQLIDLNVWKEEEIVVLSAIEIPFSLEIIRSPKQQITDVIILAKKVLAQGGQSKVRLCYSIFTGRVLVRKACESETQQSILRHFLKHPTRGIVPVVYLRPRKGKKVQVLEPLIDYSLDKAVHQLDVTAITSIAHDILHGIRAVHQLGEAHRDLKPQNILVQKIKGVWRGFITDFGLADPGAVGGTLGFRSPEQIAVEEELASIDPTLPYYSHPAPYYLRIKSQSRLSQPRGYVVDGVGSFLSIRQSIQWLNTWVSSFYFAKDYPQAQLFWFSYRSSIRCLSKNSSTSKRHRGIKNALTNRN